MRPCGFDAFCGAGGATRGYQLAGAYMVGCDINPQPRYCGEEFVQGDALELLADEEFMARFDFAHASPPCQAYTSMSNRWRGGGGRADTHLDLIASTRELLYATGLPYVLENVPGSPLRSPVVINGPNVGLRRLDRPRLFESNVVLLVPPRERADNPVGVYGRAPDGRLLFKRVDGSEQRAASSVDEARDVMGIDWMTWDELREAIPPAYCELIGHQLMAHVKARAVA